MILRSVISRTPHFIHIYLKAKIQLFYRFIRLNGWQEIHDQDYFKTVMT